jgi:hypothetical protein
MKRSRGATSKTVDSNDDEVMIVSDSRDQQQKKSSSRNDNQDEESGQVLQRLRLDAKKFGFALLSSETGFGANDDPGKKNTRYFIFQ